MTACDGVLFDLLTKNILHFADLILHGCEKTKECDTNTATPQQNTIQPIIAMLERRTSSWTIYNLALHHAIHAFVFKPQ